MTIGILPAAGKAERFMGLPKALLPCPDGYLLQRHIVNMKRAIDDGGVGVCTNEEMYPILETYCQYSSFLSNYYDRLLTVEKYETMTETVLSFYEYCKGMGQSIWHHNVLFGMPDTYIHLEGNVYESMVNILENSTMDLLIGCWQVRHKQWQQGGMVVFEQGDCIQDVIDKPETYPEHSYIWGVMAWRPTFWTCLKPEMPHVGYGIMEAVRAGLKVNAVLFKGDFYDCGTSSQYFEMIRAVTREPE